MYIHNFTMEYPLAHFMHDFMDTPHCRQGIIACPSHSFTNFTFTCLLLYSHREIIGTTALSLEFQKLWNNGGPACCPDNISLLLQSLNIIIWLQQALFKWRLSHQNYRLYIPLFCGCRPSVSFLEQEHVGWHFVACSCFP
jgi:hypothetical protein